MWAMNMTENVKVFDAGRAVLQDYLEGYPARLMVAEAGQLDDALAQGQVSPETHLLAFEIDDVLHTIPMAVVLCYNVIQGRTGGQPWMMTFCNACNTGMVFDPVLDGQTLHFRRRGSYDGLLLIWDEETDSYWQHITGQCLHGSSAGKQLRMITVTRHITAADAIAKDARTVFFNSPLTPEQMQLSGAMEKMRSNPARLETGIVATMAQEDTRRPRFELGLGVWNTGRSSFFPLTTLHTYDGALITEFEGRRLLVYQNPDAIAPVAVYLDARRATWEGDMLRLDNGAYIKHELYHTADGQTQTLERPTQLLMRWYGFALTFPGCELPVV
jgi:hypothetical protein